MRSLNAADVKTVATVLSPVTLVPSNVCRKPHELEARPPPVALVGNGSGNSGNTASALHAASVLPSTWQLRTTPFAYAITSTDVVRVAAPPSVEFMNAITATCINGSRNIL